MSLGGLASLVGVASIIDIFLGLPTGHFALGTPKALEIEIDLRKLRTFGSAG